MYQEKQHTITIDGAALDIRHVGTGQPVLLTHGVPGDVETLAPVAACLSATVHAMTVSLRHAGAGPHGTRDFGTAEQVLDLCDLIGALSLGPVHLVAWSYSAHAAMALAARHPDLVRSLMLYEPGFATFVTDPAEIEAIQQDMSSAFGPVFEALAHDDRAAALKLSIDAAAGQVGWFENQPARIREIHERNAHMVPLLLTQSPPVALSADDLATINCPTTVSWGDQTRLCYRRVSESAARLIPDAKEVVIRDAGHLLPEADPGLFAQKVAEHVAWTNAVETGGQAE